MSESAKKRHLPRKAGRAVDKKKIQPMKDQEDDSEAIERAVYDGMQDLRAKQPGKH